MVEKHQREHLVVLLSMLESQEFHSEIFDRPVGDLVKPAVLVLNSGTPLRQAVAEFSATGLDAALVQDSPDTLHGCVDRALIAENFRAGVDCQIARLMTRNISIEPVEATFLEVVGRMTKGSASNVLVVDRIGQPYFLISPRAAISIVQGIVDSQSGARRLSDVA